MGWTGHQLKNGWSLYTRGGTEGVFVQHRDKEEQVEIPQSILRMLVADDLRSDKISKLEMMPDNQILGLD